LPDLSPDFLESLRDEGLASGLPDFVPGPNLTLSGASAPDDFVSDSLAAEGVALEDFVPDDFASAGFRFVEFFADDRARDRALVAGFCASDLAFGMA
jgi:hypothetical protein